MISFSSMLFQNSRKPYLSLGSGLFSSGEIGDSDSVDANGVYRCQLSTPNSRDISLGVLKKLNSKSFGGLKNPTRSLCAQLGPPKPYHFIFLPFPLSHYHFLLRSTSVFFLFSDSKLRRQHMETMESWPSLKFMVYQVLPLP
jgi:hypothetical protein